MNWSSFKYLTKQGCKNLGANRFMTFAGVCVLTACLVLTGVAALFDLAKTLPEAMRPTGMVELGRTILPLFELNLGWVVPAVIGFLIGFAVHFSRKSKAA